MVLKEPWDRENLFHINPNIPPSRQPAHTHEKAGRTRRRWPSDPALFPTALAIGAAVIGNVVSMLVSVFTAHGVRSKVVASKAGVAGETAPSSPSPRREKLRRAFDRPRSGSWTGCGFTACL